MSRDFATPDLERRVSVLKAFSLTGCIIANDYMYFVFNFFIFFSSVMRIRERTVETRATKT